MTLVSYHIFDTGGSRSFPEGDAFLEGHSAASADIAIILGQNAAAGLSELEGSAYRAIAVELGTECLAVHAPDNFGSEGGRLIGFSRFRLGEAPPTNLIELVRQPKTDPTALETVMAVFEHAGFSVATCRDAAGRIVDRLARPYFNRALNALDTGLANAEQLDTALCMGLGYRRGPIDLLRESGLERHSEIASHLYAALGEAAYLPARSSRAAQARLATRKSRT